MHFSPKEKEETKKTDEYGLLLEGGGGVDFKMKSFNKE